MVKKPPLLLLPGLLCDEALWAHQVKALKDVAQCRVADLTGQDSVAGLARAALAKAPAKFALAGLSMGGYVALEIMRQAPERVLKLCLLDTSARPDTAEQKERRRLLMALSRQGKFRGVTPRLLPMLIHPERLSDKVLTGIVMGMAERVGREAFLRQQTAIMNRADSRPSLAKIRVPAQVIVGRQDALTPVEVCKEIADGIPGSQLTIIENSGHLSALEQPVTVGEIMRRWLCSG
ncbi:MAG TPA: alpha/beta fold hydrolase [Alphaproteobacteria bacterium]|nr:alpha/beta fold hydrolase [Alphaproteobacteria bacterium]